MNVNNVYRSKEVGASDAVSWRRGTSQVPSGKCECPRDQRRLSDKIPGRATLRGIVTLS